MTDSVPTSGPESHDNDSLFPSGAGERLRAAREGLGLKLADIAARTRVPIRHLEAIESGDYSEMPTPTYAIGFAKAYARVVGEDEVAIARDVRAQTALISAERQEYQPYELDDPTRVPPRGLAIGAAIVGAIGLIVALVWLGSAWFTPTPEEAANTAAVAPTPAATQTPLVSQAVPAPGGQVILTALDRVWVRVHDASGKTLYQGTMNPGDRYSVPADADHPQLTVGRPDQLRVSVGGRDLPPLGDGARPLSDVPLDPVALAARAASTAPGTASTAPTALPGAVPAPSATPSTTPSSRETSAAAATPVKSESKPTPKAKPKPKPSASTSKKPLALDLKPSPAPLPPSTGIY